MIRFDLANAMTFLNPNEIELLAPTVRAAHERLVSRKGPGADFLGWLDLPAKYDKAELGRIRHAAARIRKDSEILVVVGIGGSYLGARAAIEMLGHSFGNAAPKKVRKAPQVFFAGNGISSTYLADLLDVLAGKDVSINVISKSGTTTEPAVAFRVLKNWMEARYGREGARDRIYATTDASRGALRKLATEEGYETFTIPDDIGGRYSVLTAVGLLPIAVAGIDVREAMRGAKDARKAFADADPSSNPVLQYVAARNCLLRKGYPIEMLVNYEPGLHFFTEWWKQLFGESEGKDGKGIFPAGADFSTDLHSMGQYIQDGARFLFETSLLVETPRRPLAIPDDPQDLDGLNFLSGRDLDDVNAKAAQGTGLAHVDGGVPNLRIVVPALTPYWFGQLVYFFEKACAVSGYVLGVNPFDQPGVEAYKKNMFALLGKPGYEAEKARLEKRLGL
jgi:glucose-6-phosphate isomerase